MIYTCTLNPAIDLFVELEAFHPFVVNRTTAEYYQANGKGINISFILKRMGIDSTAMGFLGGFTGRFIQETLQKEGIPTDFVKVAGITRVNTFVRTQDKEYKIVNRGPVITPIEKKQILNKINQIKEGDVLFVSGSLPRGVPDEILVEIARIAQKRGFRLILDVSSKRLIDCLPYRPYLIKPNDEELAALFGEKALTDEEIVKAAYQLLNRGVQNVLVSMGAKGALFINQDLALMATAPKGKVVNTACAGDSLLAAFTGSLILGERVDMALSFGVAAGSSTAFSPGLSDLTDVPELIKQVQIKELEHHKGGF